MSVTNPHLYSWLICFYDAVKIQDLYEVLFAAGFTAKSRMPGIWYKPNKKSSTGRNPSQILSTAYEAFAIVMKGEPVLVKKGRPNVFEFDTPLGDRVHPTQKAVALGTELVETFTVPGQLILDPFCGGAAGFGAGAVRVQRKFLGIEANKGYADKAQVTMNEALKGL